MSGFEQELLDRYAGARARLMTGYRPGKPEAPPRPSARVIMRRLLETMRTKHKTPPTPRALPFLSVIDVTPAVKTGKEIMAEVARRHGLSIHDLMSERRDPKSCAARQEMCWRVRHETSLSLPQIGRLIGGRDHTTVLHSIRKYERKLAEQAQSSTDNFPGYLASFPPSESAVR